MAHPVVQNFVVHLISKQDQTMFARNRDYLQQQCVGVQRAGRVIGVDDHNSLGARRDFGADVGDIWHPALGLVAAVMHWGAAGQAGSGCPQRVVRGRQ